MTLDLAALRLLSWQGPFDPCATCGQTVGHRCRTSSNALTTPHAPRLAEAKGYDARQPEVDELQRGIDQRDQAITAANDSLRTAAENAATLTDQLKTARLGAALVPGLQQQVADLLAKIADLEKPAPAPAPEPTPTPAPVPTPTPTPTPAKRRLLVGTGGGNSDRTKQPIDIDRRYYGGSDADIAKHVAAAKANHAAGILTWATFKLPTSWADAVAGKADAWFDKLTAACRGLGFEVWIDLHHEPEGDGDGKLWRQFQARFANRLGDGATGPVKFLLCFTGYSEEYGAAGGPSSLDVLWPSEAASKVYAIAYDNPYLRYGVPLTGGALDTTWSEAATSYVKRLAARARAFGVKAAIGEWGYSDEAFAKDPAWLDRALAAMAAESDVLVAACYFDSKLNSTRSWALGAAGSPKWARFERAATAIR